jgi:predicted nucleic acid-binding protein
LALEPLAGRLRHHRRIALDTSIFIYELEANPRYVELADRVFEWLERPGRSAVTSTITITELLVQPYRRAEQDHAIELYAALTTYTNLEWIAPDLEIADMAARLRAYFGLRTPDALQAATAAHVGATLFVTNDRGFQKIDNFAALVLDDFL